MLLNIIKKNRNVGSEWDKLAPSREQAVEFAHVNINEEPQKYVGDSMRYTAEYTLAHYMELLNNDLRKDRIDKDGMHVEKMLSEHTTDTDLVLYRGVHESVYSLMKENAKEVGGCDLYEKGFMACCLVKGQELKTDIRLRIYVPAGSHVVFQGNVNEEPDFYEVDIQRGAKLQVISSDDKYINCRLLETA